MTANQSETCEACLVSVLTMIRVDSWPHENPLVNIHPLACFGGMCGFNAIVQNDAKNHIYSVKKDEKITKKQKKIVQIDRKMCNFVI